jgi:hypothetical protein
MASSTPVTTRDDSSSRRVATETKPAVKTTELIAYVVTVVGVLLAALLVDGFDAARAWLYVTILTVGYLVSRGLAKSGSRAHYSDER